MKKFEKGKVLRDNIQRAIAQRSFQFCGIFCSKFFSCRSTRKITFVEERGTMVERFEERKSFDYDSRELFLVEFMVGRIFNRNGSKQVHREQ